MADEVSRPAQPPPAPGLELPKAEAGVAFKAEMVATNLLLGYWMHALALVVVGLVAVLLWGQWRNHHESEQRRISAEISEIERNLPTPLPMLQEDVSSGKVPRTDLMAPADAMAKVAEGASGTGAVEGWLKAAELYRLAGNVERQRAALEAAVAVGDGNVLGYAAEAGLANLDLEQGKAAEAVDRFTRMRDGYEGILAQNAALDLGLSLQHLGRTDEAARVYEAFLTKWPDSPHAEEVRKRQGALGVAAAAPAPAAPEAPAEGPVAPTEPAAPAAPGAGG